MITYRKYFLLTVADVQWLIPTKFSSIIFLSPAYNYYNYIMYILYIIIIISMRPNYLTSYVIDGRVKDVFLLIHRATNMNEHSSRSHAIFIITIECSEVSYISVLYLLNGFVKSCWEQLVVTVSQWKCGMYDLHPSCIIV